MPVRAPVTEATRPVRRTIADTPGAKRFRKWPCQDGRPRIGESGVGSDAGPISVAGAVSFAGTVSLIRRPERIGRERDPQAANRA